MLPHPIALKRPARTQVHRCCVGGVCEDASMLERPGAGLPHAQRAGCIVKKNLQGTGAAGSGARPGEPLFTQECEDVAGQERRAGRSSGRRRSTRAATERGPDWAEPVGAVLVGANVLLREGLAGILTAADFRIVASTSCADDHVLSSLPQEQSMLLIVEVSDDFDAGLRQIACFKQHYPHGRVVVLADQQQVTKMVAAFRAGANAYLVKVATCETFVKSIELVMLGVTLLPPEILHLISDRQARSRSDRAADEVADDRHADEEDDGGEDGDLLGTNIEPNKQVAGADGGHPPRLSARQQAILRCLAEGDSNKTIARKMAMAEATVKVHVKAILRKIRVNNRTQAAIWAMSGDPLVPPKDETSPAPGPAPVERFPFFNIANVLSEGYRNGSMSSTTIKLKQANPVPLRLVRKDD